MAKRDRGHAGGNASFRIQYIRFSTEQIVALNQRLDLGPDRLWDMIDKACDDGWKFSFSKVSNSDRKIVSVTDKAGRVGCEKLVQCIEHSSLTSAIGAALYLVEEICDDGCGDYSDASDPW